MNYYVNGSALCEGDRSQERPFKRIGDAAIIAMPGDEIIVAKGVYREYVNPARGGKKDARIVYRSEEPLGAVITGAEVVKGWTKYKKYKNVWTVRIPNGIFGSYNPYTTEVYGDWYFAPAVRHTGAVYLNDRMLYETESLEECIAGEVYSPSWVPEESKYKWFTEQDGNETVLYANFQGADPNKENVEINVRRRCFFPEKTGRSYITVSGFAMTKAATTWAPPAAFQDGLIGPHWSKGWIIEDCEISNSKCCGISLGKYNGMLSAAVNITAGSRKGSVLTLSDAATFTIVNKLASSAVWAPSSRSSRITTFIISTTCSSWEVRRFPESNFTLLSMSPSAGIISTIPLWVSGATGKHREHVSHRIFCMITSGRIIPPGQKAAWAARIFL